MADEKAHPVYPSPPVALVVLAAEFPPVSTTEEVLGRLRERLRTDFPLIAHGQQQRVTVQGGEMQQEIRSVPRFTTRDRTMAVAVTHDGMVIETSRYLGFDWYLDLVRGPVSAIAEVLAPDAIVSLGHRYIDEVRVPDSGALVDWKRWIHPDLLVPARLPVDASVPAPNHWQSTVSYQTTSESSLTLRYGPMEGLAVPADGATRRLGPVTAGQYFLLDWDSRWQPEVAPEFSVEEILNSCRKLYDPVRRLFRYVTTEELRKVFAARQEER